MKKAVALTILFPFLLLSACQPRPKLADAVNPLIGTAFNGHTFPGSTVPFGMVSPSPDTGLNDWQHCSGYHHDDSTLLGFSQTHMSGTGAPDMCDLLILPVNGELPANGYGVSFQHESEVARPGYYAVTLDQQSIRCEMTATEHCSFYRFTFLDKQYPQGLLFDMLHGNDGGIY